jgi:Iron-containing redox enzyme
MENTMHLPTPRGTTSATVLDALATPADRNTSHAALERLAASVASTDPTSDDFQLALWVLYELHYRGFDDVDEAWEWSPALLQVRARMETVFEGYLRERTRDLVSAAVEARGDIATRVTDLLDDVEGPSLARFLQREATHEQCLEFLVQRSIYHLKESDPHSWVIPRLSDPVKARLVELQYDEYGAGRPERLHATLFADGMAACGLNAAYGAYLDVVPGYTLAVSNAMSLFGLHRRLRGAAMGHLAAFEATSSLPCRRYAMGIRRLGLAEQVAEYFDEHVEADAVHEQLALRDICGQLVEEDPRLAEDVFFGAAVCGVLDADAATPMIDAWQRGQSSLLADSQGAVA